MIRSKIKVTSPLQYFIIIPVFFAFFFIGVVCAFIFYGMFKGTYSFVSTASSATGKVIEIVSRSSHSSRGGYSKTFSPKIEFLADGQKLTFVSKIYSSFYPRIGQEVKVLYDPQFPQNAEISSFFRLWFGAILISIFAVMFTSISAPLLFSSIFSLIKYLHSKTSPKK